VERRPTYAPRAETGGLGRRKAEVQAMATRSTAAKRPDAVLREDEGMVMAGWLEREGRRREGTAVSHCD
jgi:hypothetical protein